MMSYCSYKGINLLFIFSWKFEQNETTFLNNNFFPTNFDSYLCNCPYIVRNRTFRLKCIFVNKNLPKFLKCHFAHCGSTAHKTNLKIKFCTHTTGYYFRNLTKVCSNFRESTIHPAEPSCRLAALSVDRTFWPMSTPDGWFTKF